MGGAYPFPCGVLATGWTMPSDAGASLDRLPALDRLYVDAPVADGANIFPSVPQTQLVVYLQ